MLYRRNGLNGTSKSCVGLLSNCGKDVYCKRGYYTVNENIYLILAKEAIMMRFDS